MNELRGNEVDCSLEKVAEDAMCISNHDVSIRHDNKENPNRQYTQEANVGAAAVSEPKPSILLLGAGGFIGCHLVNRLCVDGWTVTCIDIEKGKIDLISANAKRGGDESRSSSCTLPVMFQISELSFESLLPCLLLTLQT